MCEVCYYKGGTGGSMRNLVLILVALIAVATFIRAYEAPRGDTTKSFSVPIESVSEQ